MRKFTLLKKCEREKTLLLPEYVFMCGWNVLVLFPPLSVDDGGWIQVRKTIFRSRLCLKLSHELHQIVIKVNHIISTRWKSAHECAKYQFTYEAKEIVQVQITIMISLDYKWYVPRYFEPIESLLQFVFDHFNMDLLKYEQIYAALFFRRSSTRTFKKKILKNFCEAHECARECNFNGFLNVGH